MRVLRISHSAVVGAWRERERELESLGVDVQLLSALRWNEGGTLVQLESGPHEAVTGVRTFGSHPALFLYDPRPIWHAMDDSIELLDIHEEPFALATAQVRLIRALRYRGRRRPPYTLYSAQNIFKRFPFPFGALERAALRGTAAVSVCNTGAREVLQRKGLRAPAPVIGLGVNVEHFTDGDREPAETTLGTLVVGYAGRLADHKGISVLLDALSGTEQFTLLLAGDGPARSTLEARAAHLGSRVRFLGPLGQDDLPNFYRSIDVLAVPSLTTKTWIEQFGRVAVEAMACGTPVVASDSGALPDVVGDTGVLVPPGDAAALRRALISLADDPGQRRVLAAKGRAKAATYSWSTIAGDYLDMYRGVLDGPAAVAQAAEAPYRPDLPDVIVVAYGSPGMVRSAIAPLSDRYDIIVVDNSSMPQIRALADELGATYIDPGTNRGFAAGVNIGLSRRTNPHRDVLLLNPDATIAPDDVAALQQALHTEPAIASVGPAQVDANGVPARVVWSFPSPGRTWLEALGLGSFVPVRGKRTFVIGSILLMKAAALKDVGHFDERFFLYAEETDWSLRAVQRGWRHQYVPETRAIHLGAATSTDNRRRETHFHASQEKYLRKHFGSIGWHFSRGGALLGAAVRMTLLRGERRAVARGRWALYRHGPIRSEAELVAECR